jgi:hypothetical protein
VVASVRGEATVGSSLAGARLWSPSTFATASLAAVT